MGRQRPAMGVCVPVRSYNLKNVCIDWRQTHLLLVFTLQVPVLRRFYIVVDLRGSYM